MHLETMTFTFQMLDNFLESSATSFMTLIFAKKSI